MTWRLYEVAWRTVDKTIQGHERIWVDSQATLLSPILNPQGVLRVMDEDDWESAIYIAVAQRLDASLFLRGGGVAFRDVKYTLVTEQEEAP